MPPPPPPPTPALRANHRYDSLLDTSLISFGSVPPTLFTAYHKVGVHELPPTSIKPVRSHHTKKGNPLRVHVKIWRLWKKVPSLRDNYSMEVDLLKYSHTSHERANIVNLFQWHDGQHFCETDKEGIFTCEWSYCVLHVCWESFDIFIESGLFRLGGAQISGGKKYEARTLPFKVYMVKLLAEHCGKGKRWVYVAWYVHATLWKIPMVGWDLLGAFLAYLDSTVHPYCMQIFVSM